MVLSKPQIAAVSKPFIGKVSQRIPVCFYNRRLCPEYRNEYENERIYRIMNKRVLSAILILATTGSFLFLSGLCMWLIPMVNATTLGVVLAIIGAVTLLSCWIIVRKHRDTSNVSSGNAALAWVIGIIGVLISGTGVLTLTLISSQMMLGIVKCVFGAVICIYNAGKNLRKTS